MIELNTEVKEYTEYKVDPDIEGLVERMERITGYTREQLMLQMFLSNFPQLLDQITPSDLSPYFVEGKTKFPFWFHLDPHFGNILRELYKKYEKKLEMSELVELLLLFAHQDRLQKRKTE